MTDNGLDGDLNDGDLNDGDLNDVGFDNCSVGELAHRISEFEATPWFGRLRALRSNGKGIDAFAIGFAAGQRFSQGSTQGDPLGRNLIEPAIAQTTVPSLLGSHARTAAFSAVVGAALTWLTLSIPRWESMRPNGPKQQDSPLAVAVAVEPSTINRTIDNLSPIEQLMASPWRERALVTEQVVQRPDLRQSVPDSDPESLLYVRQRRQWLTSLEYAP